MSTFANFKAGKTNLDHLINKTDAYANDVMWKPTRDKTGNGGAVIRFLPAVADGEDSPVVQVMSHGFKVGNKWLIENCPKQHKNPCPICEALEPMWDNPELKPTASSRNKKTNYYANVLVINDTSNPDNNGKVFMFRFGKKIFEKIQQSMKPDELLGDAPVNPFDLQDGADFRLRISTVAGFPNYDASSFGTPKALTEKDIKVEEWNKLLKPEYSLAGLTSADKYKTYDDLKRKYNEVVGVANKDVAYENTAKQEVYSAPKQSSTNVDEDDSMAEYAALLAD